MRNWIFVKVVTNQPGLVGWGEATLEWHTRSVVGAVEDVAQLLIGEDPTRVEHLWQMMWRQHFWHGSGIVRGTAIAGIDLALWDIAGKALGAPCHQLWGGPVRDSIRLYCHLGGGNLDEFYETPVENAQRFAELAAQAVDDGFTAFKSMAVPPTMPIEGLKPVKAAEACVAAMRDAVGDDIDVMVDCHARPSPAMGLKFAKALDPYGLYFFEEPCWPESIEGLAAINAAVATPIATGERLTTYRRPWPWSRIYPGCRAVTIGAPFGSNSSGSRRPRIQRWRSRWNNCESSWHSWGRTTRPASTLASWNESSRWCTGPRRWATCRC